MSTLDWIVVGASTLLCSWWIWEMICMERAYRQRRDMIASWPLLSPRFDIMRNAYHAVTYNEHWRSLALGLDPYRLYPVDAFPEGDERRRRA